MEFDGDEVAGVVFVGDLAEEDFHAMALPVRAGRNIGIVACLGRGHIHVVQIADTELQRIFIHK